MVAKQDVIGTPLNTNMYWKQNKIIKTLYLDNLIQNDILKLNKSY